MAVPYTSQSLSLSTGEMSGLHQKLQLGRQSLLAATTFLYKQTPARARCSISAFLGSFNAAEISLWPLSKAANVICNAVIQIREQTEAVGADGKACSCRFAQRRRKNI